MLNRYCPAGRCHSQAYKWVSRRKPLCARIGWLMELPGGQKAIAAPDGLLHPDGKNGRVQSALAKGRQCCPAKQAANWLRG